MAKKISSVMCGSIVLAEFKKFSDKLKFVIESMDILKRVKLNAAVKNAEREIKKVFEPVKKLKASKLVKLPKLNDTEIDMLIGTVKEAWKRPPKKLKVTIPYLAYHAKQGGLFIDIEGVDDNMNKLLKTHWKTIINNPTQLAKLMGVIDYLNLFD